MAFMRRGAAVLAGGMLTAWIGCAGSDVPLAPPTLIRIGVGSKGGDFDVMGRALAKTLQEGQPGVVVEVVNNEGAVSSLESVEQGRSDCGFSYANLAYEGFVGKLSDEPGPFKQLRGVALVESTPLHFIVRRRAGIRSVRDLIGRSVSLGPRGSGSYRAALPLMAAFGADSASVKIQNEPFNTSVKRMRAGELDAYFLLAGRPANLIPNQINSNTELLPLEGATIDALRERFPFLHAFVIPGGTYPGQAAPIRTVAVDSLLLCRNDFGAADVKRVTGDWFATLAALTKYGKVTDALNAGLASATPIPLHAGASEYYRARQVLLH